MLETVKVTGTFYDMSQRPLSGVVFFTPEPEYIADQPQDAIYAGRVSAPLAEDGSLSADIVASNGWRYKISFQLKNRDGGLVKMRDAYASFPSSGALPDFLKLGTVAGSAAPVAIFSDTGEPGTVFASGVVPDPEDAGAILVPIN